MVSMEQDHSFPGRHLLQLGIVFGNLTVVSRVSCARVVHCVARQEGEDSSIYDPFHPMPMIAEKSLCTSK